MAENQIAVLVSGGASTMEAYVQAQQENPEMAEVGLVVTSKQYDHEDAVSMRKKLAGIQSDFGLDIPVEYIGPKSHPKGKVERGQTNQESEAIADLLIQGKFAAGACMGYMRIVRGALYEEFGSLPSHKSMYQARLLNTHPGPLPETRDTYGEGTSQRVLDLGMSESAHTVHVVTDGIDEGEQIARNPVPVLPGMSADDLFQAVQLVEKEMLPQDINRFLDEQKTWREEQAW